MCPAPVNVWLTSMRACCCAAWLQRPRKAYPSELSQFHSEDYIEFLSKVTPDSKERYAQQLRAFGINDDCPVFDNMFK